MAQWIFLSELDRARHLYLDAYKQLHSEASAVIEDKYWNDLDWLEKETDELVTKWAKTRSNIVDMAVFLRQ